MEDTNGTIVQPNNIQHVKSFNPLSLIVLIVFLFIGVLIGYGIAKYNPNTSKEMTASNQTTPTPTPTTSIGTLCSKYGLLLPEDFLTKYTMQDVDTFASVASSQLNNSLRENELIELNKKYPQTNPSATTAGSTIFLPPQDVISSGSLFAVGGRLMRVEDKTYWLQTRTSNSSQGDYPLNTNARTKFRTTPQIGQCVIGVIDQNASVGAGEAILIYAY